MASDVSSWWFDAWSPIVRTVVVGAAAYAVLIVVLRASGKRTLSKMTAFDLVVTVALGSTLATLLLDSRTALAQGAAGLATLVGLQTAIAWMASRSHRIDRMVKADPTLLVHRGRLLHAALRRERVSETDVRAALRQAGLGRVEEVEAVVLESDGTISVIAREGRPVTALRPST